MKPNDRVANNNGFTLLELMVTVSIVAIVASLAAPAMKSFSRNQMIVGAINDLSSDIQYARSEAVSRKTPIQICPSSDGLNCRNSKSWGEGWIIQITNTAMCPAVDDCILKVRGELNSGISLNASISAGFTFDDQGVTTESVTFALCDVDESASSSNLFLRTYAIKKTGSSYIRKGASTCDP